VAEASIRLKSEGLLPMEDSKSQRLQAGLHAQGANIHGMANDASPELRQDPILNALVLSRIEHLLLTAVHACWRSVVAGIHRHRAGAANHRAIADRGRGGKTTANTP